MLKLGRACFPKCNRAAVVLLLVPLAIFVSRGQTNSPVPLSPRLANYAIDVVLDASNKTLSGSETLHWTNDSRDRVSELRFHLYLNAFRNSVSTFMRESGGTSRGISAGQDGWGFIDITRLRLKDGADLLPGSSFIAPDDGNEHDRTVLSVPLPRSVRPGETVALEIEFHAQLPQVFARTGFSGNFFFVGQWFPKIGVYEPAGMRGRKVSGWNCHQFHSNTEFYADYGVYNVAITIPKDFIVGATGLKVGERPSGDTAKTHIYRAEDVHDFAWTCSPDYVVVEDTWKHVAVRLLMQPEHLETKTDRYLTAIRQSLQYFAEWIGEYPYTTLTVVDPPIYATGAGGMEYPTLITGLSIKYLPETIREVEAVTIHEFGHEFWYGLVANNEFEEAWLDEGVNQYSEARIMDDYYGDDRSQTDLLGFHQGDGESARSSTHGMKYPKAFPVNTFAWKLTHGTYGDLTYNKTAIVLATLERILGREVFDEAIRTYFERWKFKHPSRNDFVAVFSEVVKRRMGDAVAPSVEWFFSQSLHGTNTCDYEVAGISSRSVRGPQGIGTTGTTTPKASRFANEVFVYRRGELTLPVELLVVYANGDSTRKSWDGMARTWTVRDTTDSRVVYATVDPERKILLDENLLNNARSEEGIGGTIWKYALKTLFWTQTVMQSMSIF